MQGHQNMQLNIKEFLKHADVQDSLYPGKRIVKPCTQIGEYKNHCVVIDWRDPDLIRIDIKPGLSGKQLAPEIIKQYPVNLQIPTYVKIKVINDNEKSTDDDDEESEEKSKGKSGGGGKKPARKKLEDIELIAARFGDSVEGSIPTLGEIKEMMVMGIQLAQESFNNAFAELTNQMNHAKIAVTEILSKAADIVTKVTPPEYITPSGDETQKYDYDRERNANIGFKPGMT